MDLEKTNTFYLVPKEVLDKLVTAINYLNLLHDKSEKEQDLLTPGDYITETIASNMLSRGKTWFYNKRKSHELPAKKAAGRWYYKRQDIIKYIESSEDLHCYKQSQ